MNGSHDFNARTHSGRMAANERHEIHDLARRRGDGDRRRLRPRSGRGRSNEGRSGITYATFLDPNNHNDPRAAAQTCRIDAFEKANPAIHVRIQVDSVQQEALRALRAGFDTPCQAGQAGPPIR